MHHKSIQFKYIDFVCVEEDVETVFAVPVLLSGLASLVLTAKEEKMLGQHHKVHLQRLLRLHQATLEPVVFFSGRMSTHTGSASPQDICHVWTTLQIERGGQHSCQSCSTCPPTPSPGSGG